VVKDDQLERFIDLLMTAIKAVGADTSRVYFRYLSVGELEFKDVERFTEFLQLKPLTEIIIIFENFKRPPQIERPITLKVFGEITGQAGTAYFIRIRGVDVPEYTYEHGEYEEGQPRGALKQVIDFIKKYGDKIAALIDLAVNLLMIGKMILDG
jgi:hypothetical protein